MGGLLLLLLLKKTVRTFSDGSLPDELRNSDSFDSWQWPVWPAAPGP